MTADVLRFGRKETVLEGTARCAACQTEWQAQAPVGVDWLECPSCRLFRGRFLHPAVPKEGEDIWRCACGCDVFRITRKEAFCINCGTRQAFWP